MSSRSPTRERFVAMTETMLETPKDRDAFHDRIDFLRDVLQRWLTRPDTVLACGRWSDGAIGEFNSLGRAQVLSGRYKGCFSGVCDIRLEGQPHHLHVDLGRVAAVRYCLCPSVCFGFKPSVEVRFMLAGQGGSTSERWSLAAMVENPYVNGQLDEARLTAFLEEAAEQCRNQPDWAALWIDREVWTSEAAPQIEQALCRSAGVDPAVPDARAEALRSFCPEPKLPTPGDRDADPLVLPLLEQAVDLQEASLVILRERTLVELQTHQLEGVFKFVEQGHVSWQIGGFTQSHCHLDLYGLTGVQFAAEPTPCQGGRLNFTVWFLTGDRSGNPYKWDGYFSVVLNQPYESQGAPRAEVIEPMLALYRSHRGKAWVDADERFQAVADGGLDALRRLNQDLLSR